MVIRVEKTQSFGKCRRTKRPVTRFAILAESLDFKL